MLRKSYHKTLLLFFFLLTFQSAACLLRAQDEEELRPIDRIFFGGNFGMQFGTITNIEVSPLIGYHITPRLSAGIGTRFEYFKDKGLIYPYETTIYGGSVFSRFVVIQNLGEGLGIGLNTGLFTQVEYEMLSLEREYFEPPYNGTGRFLVHSVLVGGGIIQPIGRRSAFLLSVLYNLNESARSPYSNPIIRIGFNF
jgi:hypothetical protein